MTPDEHRSPFPEPAPTPPPGYLDAVAGQPLLPAARQAWLAAAEQAWSDPARLHHQGRRTGLLLDTARASLAAGLGVLPTELYLASSGPTAVGAAVQGLLGRPDVPRRVIATSVESLAVLSPAGRWAEEVDLVPVDATGAVRLESLAAALERPAAVVCVQAANGEVGTRQPLAEAHRLARAAGIPLLCHAVQVVGHGPLPEAWDVLAASARDWAGPAGVGVLAVRARVPWAPEENPDRGWVGGFPDVPGAAAAATALEHVLPVAEAEAARHARLTARLREELPAIDDGITVAGDPVNRLPHVVTFTCAGTVGEALVHELAARGLSVASGSACTSDLRMPSQVLAAMGLAADASVRLSLPYGCTEDTVDALLSALPDALHAARG